MSKNTVSQEKADTLRKLISKIRSFPENFTDEEVFDSLFEVQSDPKPSSKPDWKSAVRNSKKLYFNEYYNEFTVKTDTETFFYFAEDDPKSEPTKGAIEVPLEDEDDLMNLQNTILLEVSGEDSKLEELEYISRFPGEIEFDEKIYLPNLKKVSIPNYEPVHSRMIPSVETIRITNPSLVDISLDKIPDTLKEFYIPPENQPDVITETPDFFGFLKDLRKKVPDVKINVKERTAKTWCKNHPDYAQFMNTN